MNEREWYIQNEGEKERERERKKERYVRKTYIVKCLPYKKGVT